jgi:PAS domain S-box-containing protein
MHDPESTGLRSPSRLAALRATGLLDPRPAPPIDRLTELAAGAVGTPFAATTLLDERHELLKSCVGLPEGLGPGCEIPVSAAVSPRLLDAAEPLAVADVRSEEDLGAARVVAEGGWGACAGVALRVEGEVLGGLWIADREPREWEGRALGLLGRTGAAVAREMELRVALGRAEAGASAAGASGEGEAETDRLRRSEERYRLVSQATSDAMLEWVVESGELEWDGAGPRMLRYTPEEAGNDVAWFYERIHPEDRERVVREQEALLAGTGGYWSGEYRFLRGDGRYACVLHRGCVVRDARGRPLRMIGSLMDVSERKQAEDAQRFLARASELLDSSLDYEATLGALARLAVPTLADYCLVDLAEDDGVLRRVGAAHADPAKERLLRRDESVRLDADAEHHPVLAVVSTGEAVLVPDCSHAVLDRIAHDRAHRAGLEAVGLRSFMIVPLRAHERVLGAITLAACDEGRRYQPVDLVVAEDLARRAATAIQHALLYREVRQAVSDRDDVLGFVTHDLRNPLNTVHVAASLLLETEEERRSGNRKWLETIKLASQQMNSLIHDLFEVTRMGVGAFTLTPARHPPADIVDTARELLEPLAGASGVRLACTCADGLPPLWIDFDQVLRVLSNLVGNAIKFTPRGGAITVEAEADPDGRAVRFSVADTGPGIADDELQHVFERYWQGREGDRRGAGMGLAIARGIVAAHGGSIRAENAPSGGAVFRFTLPVDPPDAP